MREQLITQDIPGHGPLFITLHRGDVQHPIMHLALAPGGSVYWDHDVSQRSPILYGEGQQLQRFRIILYTVGPEEGAGTVPPPTR